MGVRPFHRGRVHAIVIGNFFGAMKTMNQTFDVEGMTCGHCERAVTKAVKAVDPNAQVKVDLGANRVEVESDQLRDVIAGAIRDEGYTVAA